MKRQALSDLSLWAKKPLRKPLVLRGARQVGKSTLIRLLAEQESFDLIEINCEIETLNSVNQPNFALDALINEIQLKKQKKFHDTTLLFLDEIQENPRLLKMLRYFYEKRPDIKVVAAGSLLELALKAENFSFPVGRVEFYHMNPMSFQEFLWATHRPILDEQLTQFVFSSELHQSALEALKEYYIVGGMPEAVKVFSETKNLLETRQIQGQILQGFQADFPKYHKKIEARSIAKIFERHSGHLGQKIIYSKLNEDAPSKQNKATFELLTNARVILPCTHTNGNTPPLAGESDPRVFKSYFLDIGLLNSQLGTDINIFNQSFKSNAQGLMAEQYVAQHLQSFYGPQKPPQLFYHLRDKNPQKAEIDFLIEELGEVLPFEVKSSAKGHLKSLKYFCETKKSKLAFKVCLDEFRIQSDFFGNAKLVTLPLYAIDYLRPNLGKLFVE